MKLAFALVLAVHGLIHLMGFAKAFGYAELPQLTVPISRAAGVLWLAAAGLVVLTAVLVYVWPRGWWIVGAVALVVSQVVIAGSWADARFGTVANVILLAGVGLGFAWHGPMGFQAEFTRDAARLVDRGGSVAPITDADLAHLPPPVQRYLRLTGAVGRDRVFNFRARFRGDIRRGANDPWMPFTVVQYEGFDPPVRLFLMEASLRGIPFQALHVMRDGTSTMRVRAAGVVPVANAAGAEMDRSESVTLLNDMALLAPATLIDPGITWEASDDRTAKARFIHGRHTVAATLVFNDAGELADFVSDDRSMAAPDGRSFTPARWSTPFRDYRTFDGRRLGTRGEGRWHLPAGAFDYIRLEVVDIAYNVAKR